MASSTEGSDGAPSFAEIIDPLAGYLKDVMRTTGTDVFEDATDIIGNADKDGDGTLNKDEVHGALYTIHEWSTCRNPPTHPSHPL